MNILIICNCASGLDTFRGMLITGKINTKNIGNYDADVYMMKYNEIMIKK